MARGSLAEVETLLILAERLRMLGPTVLQELLDQSAEISKMLSGLRRSLRPKQL